MDSSWKQERIFFTVKAYPTISSRYGEACCTAGLTVDGNWIRIYPLPLRALESETKFAKYTWVDAQIKKSSDPRCESYITNIDSIEVVEHIPTTDQWARRNSIVLPKCSQSLEAIQEQRTLYSQTLAIIKPRQIIGLEIDDTPDEIVLRQLATINQMQQQMHLFPRDDISPLEIVPYSFRYEFICDDDRCRGHKMKIVDWEIYQAYRKWRVSSNWQDLIRQKFMIELPQKHLHLFLGTMHRFPDTWIIIGLYYPSSQAMQSNMFDS